MLQSKQQYTSAKTCIDQVPAGMKKVSWLYYDRNLDYGGGKYDTATRWLSKRGVDSYVYDPFNRSKIHNDYVLKEMKRDAPNMVTLFNVLNVIKEKEVRLDILKNIKDLAASEAWIHITCYRGRGNKGRKTSGGWQNNKPLSWYLPEVQTVFPDAYIWHGVIVAKKIDIT